MKNYNEEATRLLLDEFGAFGKPGIVKVFVHSHQAYAIAWKRCYEAMGEILAGKDVPKPLQKLKSPRKAKVQVANLSLKQVKSKFLREELEFLRSLRNQDKEEEVRKAAHVAYLEECEKNGLLLECECCYGEHVPEETIQCVGGHLFCKGCAQRYVENQLSGEGGLPQLRCPSTDGCQECLPKSELRRVLPQALLDSYEEQVAKASIEAAVLNGGLTGLERCPFCDFAIQMELSPEENKIFVCQSAQCGKESCRLCKEENHLPLKCKEVEGKKHTDFRVTVEERMTEALVRVCPGCKAKGVVSRFVKSDGCNKMTCPKCKGWVCYQCSEQIDKKVGYVHFCQHARNPGCPCKTCDKCDLWSGTEEDLARAEAKRVAEAGHKAHEEYKADHAGEDLQDDLAVLKDSRTAPLLEGPRDIE